jgi:uncharacterized membrane protein (TIGR02234 family)
MSRRRVKSIAVLAGIALAGLTLLSWTQTWFVLTLTGASAAQHPVPVDGGSAAPALAALGLAGLALIGALTLAGPLVRRVLGAVEILIGVGIVGSAVSALANPITVGSTLVTKATGIAGTESVEHLVGSVTQEPWPWIAMVLGVLTCVLGAILILIRRRWPQASRRFQASRPGQESPVHTAATDWDELSRGSDPTSR